MKTKYALIIGSALVLAACQEKASREAHLAAPESFQAALGKVFEGYAGIQAALARDDLPMAKEAFSSMHADLHMMPKEGLDPATKAYWDSADSRIMAVLHPMASAETLASARAHFMDFSLMLIDAVEKIGLGGDAQVYRFHCPMAGNGKGADWLQKDAVAANPYFGESMRSCGETVRKWRFPPRAG